jgi:cytochrome c-type biogenesis protein CcmH
MMLGTIGAVKALMVRRAPSPLAAEGVVRSMTDEGSNKPLHSSACIATIHTSRVRVTPHPPGSAGHFLPQGEKGRANLRWFACFLLFFLSFAPGFAFAVTPDEMLADPKLEARAQALSAQLRCMVCQNESVDESEAPLAHDMRVLVRQRILAGDSDAVIRAFLVARYGDFILLKPPFKPETYLLWAAPFLLLLAGGAAIALSLKQRKTSAQPSLSAAEKARLTAIVGDEKS